MTNKDKTRNKIMEMALTLFSEQGYNNTTTKQIADKAGVNEITLFRHFGTKENLFQETTSNCVHQINVRQVIFQYIDYSFEEAMREIVQECLKCCLSNIKLFKIQIRMGDDENELMKFKIPREFKTVLTEFFEKLKLENRINGDPKVMATTLVSSILGAFTIYVITNNTFSKIDIRDIVDQYAQQFACFYGNEYKQEADTDLVTF